jgi:hypothetical protein
MNPRASLTVVGEKSRAANSNQRSSNSPTVALVRTERPRRQTRTALVDQERPCAYRAVGTARNTADRRPHARQCTRAVPAPQHLSQRCRAVAVTTRSAEVSAPLFDRAAILDHLTELNTELAQQHAERVDLLVVGGSYLALRGLRAGTRDIDTAPSPRQSSEARHRCRGRTTFAACALAQRLGDAVPTGGLRRHTHRGRRYALTPHGPSSVPRRRVLDEAQRESRRG